jgi:Mg2+/Co2+ transporter CorB
MMIALLFIAALVTLAGSAFFSGAETGFLSVSR